MHHFFPASIVALFRCKRGMALETRNSKASRGDWLEETSNAGRNCNSGEVDGVGGDYSNRLRGLPDVADLVDLEGVLYSDRCDRQWLRPATGGTGLEANVVDEGLPTSQFFQLL